MAGKNWHEIYVANPATTNITGDIFYFARSPYTSGNDFAISWNDFSAQFALFDGTNATGTWGIDISGTAAEASDAAAITVTSAVTNTTFYPVFVGATSGSNQPHIRNTFTYNPSTNTLTATNFAGNATTATSATTAGSATTAANLTGLAAHTLYGNPTGSLATGTTITLGSGLAFTGSVLNTTGSSPWFASAASNSAFGGGAADPGTPSTSSLWWGLGSSCASGSYAFCIGNGSVANGNYTFCIGNSATSAGLGASFHSNVGSAAFRTYAFAGANVNNSGCWVSGDSNFNPVNPTGDDQWHVTYQGGHYFHTGDVSVSTAGKGLKVAEGSNAKQGIATLVGGTVVVSNTSVTSNSRIFLTIQSPGGTLGSVYIAARTAGTSFTISSTSVIDTSVVAYQIFEPA